MVNLCRNVEYPFLQLIPIRELLDGERPIIPPAMSVFIEVELIKGTSKPTSNVLTCRETFQDFMVWIFKRLTKTIVYTQNVAINRFGTASNLLAKKRC
jgi:hypothetical protein